MKTWKKHKLKKKKRKPMKKPWQKNEKPWKNIEKKNMKNPGKPWKTMKNQKHFASFSPSTFSVSSLFSALKESLSDSRGRKNGIVAMVFGCQTIRSKKKVLGSLISLFLMIFEAPARQTVPASTPQPGRSHVRCYIKQTGYPNRPTRFGNFGKMNSQNL